MAPSGKCAMTVLVTGGAGYIGAHMVKALLDAGHLPITLDNLSTGNRRQVLGGEFIQGDVGDDTLLDFIFQSNAIDAVMHFAAFTEVEESVKNPTKFYANNVSATEVLLKAMARHSIHRLVYSSSASIYGDPGYTPIDERHPCRPTNPYGETKLAVETMLKRIESDCGIRSVCLRYFNAAGADPSCDIGESHEPETHLIPLVLQTASGKRPHVNIYGSDYDTPDGTCVRDYVYVNDLVSAHMLSLEHLVGGGGSEIFNVGTNTGCSVREVIEIAAAVCKKEIPAVEAERRQGDTAFLVADSNRIQQKLGWKPSVKGVTQIIQTAWDWHRNGGDLGPRAHRAAH